jgi:hypothetical protein
VRVLPAKGQWTQPIRLFTQIHIRVFMVKYKCETWIWNLKDRAPTNKTYVFCTRVWSFRNSLKTLSAWYVRALTKTICAMMHIDCRRVRAERRSSWTGMRHRWTNNNDLGPHRPRADVDWDDGQCDRSLFARLFYYVASTDPDQQKFWPRTHKKHILFSPPQDPPSFSLRRYQNHPLFNRNPSPPLITTLCL